MKKKFIIIIFLIFGLWSNSYAEVFNLNNGDRISGEIISQDKNIVLIKTEAMGEISVEREFLVITEVKEEVSSDKEKLWAGEFSIGYNDSGGNTQNNQMISSFYANRKTDYNEFTIKGDSYYSSSNKKMDAQSWQGMGRCAFSFWDNKWYDFYKIEADHDKFASVDYRLIPSIGIGYWLTDTEDLKVMIESGLGFEHTSYNDGTDNDNEAVLIPRAFFKKKFLKNNTISQDITLYPSLGDIGEFRLRSETALTSPINEKISLRFSFINDYDSLPAKDAKKNDTKIISALVYSF